MFKIVLALALVAVVAATAHPEPKATPKADPGLVAAAYSAPIVAAGPAVAYASPYSAPLAYSAGYVAPSVYAAGYSPYSAPLIVV